ncbi:MAG: multicopper oxidase domain-containing protein [Actinomycetota bacterium]
MRFLITDDPNIASQIVQGQAAGGRAGTENRGGMLSRREFLRMGAIGGAALALPADGALALLAEKERPFRVPLSIPPVLKPVRSDGDRDFYRLTMKAADARILPGKRTRVWGFDGRFPGPTIKARRGREIVVRQVNRLNVDTTIHLHGGHVAAENDGHPMDLIPPGDRRDYHYPNLQEAATLWYHDHTHHHTSRNVYMGLAGLYLIEDAAEDELNLPRGAYDIPLVIQNRSFNSDGSFRFRGNRNVVKGNTILVNGRPQPFLKVANRKYRFRILNASNTRGYTLGLDPAAPLVQIASDGGLLPAPYTDTNLSLWPAERAEVVIDFSAFEVGSKVVLHDLKDPLDPSSATPVMRFDVEREEEDPSSLPPMLRPIDRLVGVTERVFELSLDQVTRTWVINGKPFSHRRIDAEPRLGDTEIWTFRNLSQKTHPMHVHLVMFQVLTRNNLPPAGNELGWKDTVRVGPAETVRVAMRFTDFAGRYVFHCHNLAHEDHSMMGQMRVVE